MGASRGGFTMSLDGGLEEVEEFLCAVANLRNFYRTNDLRYDL
jgi:hypothetical protein